MQPRLRKPTVADIPALSALLAPHAERVLPRTPRQLAERLRDWTLAVKDGRLVGAASVGLVDLDLAEVGVLLSEDGHIQDMLLDAILEEATELGARRVFVATDEPGPFAARGFTQRPVATIPEKRDRQCLRCPRMPRCRKVALDRALSAEPLRAAG